MDIACDKGYFDIVKLLLDCFADMDDNMLHMAASKGHVAIVQLLLLNEADEDTHVYKVSV